MRQIKEKKADFYSLEREVSSNAFEINENIIPSKDLQFLLMSMKGKFNALDEDDRYMGENLHRWIQHKEENTYGTKDKKAKNVLESDRGVRKVKQKWTRIENQKLIDDLVEHAIGDLLEAILADQEVTVLKTSDYDDIKHGMDYILISKHGGMIGIDLTLATDRGTIDRKNYRGKTTPLEFNITVGKTYYEVNNNRIDLIGNKHGIERITLPLEPNLAQKFMMEYIDQIVGFDNPDEITKDIAMEAWEITKEEYADGEVDITNNGIYFGQDQEMVISTIERTQRELLSALKQ